MSLSTMHRKQEPTIFLAAEEGFQARYLLRTDIFTTLKQKGARIVVLVPNSHEGYMAEEFADINVFPEYLDVPGYYAYRDNSRLQRYLQMMRWQALPAQDDLVYLNEKTQDYRSDGVHPLVKGATDFGSAILRRSAPLRKLLQQMEIRTFRATQVHGELFDRWQPDLVVTCCLGYQPCESYLLREARSRRIRTAAVLSGWDRSIGKGMAGASPDVTVVWSPTMRDEVVGYQAFPPEQVHVSGVAIFDLYWSKERLHSQEELFTRFGLDPARKLILFGAKSPRSYPNFGILEILA